MVLSVLEVLHSIGPPVSFISWLHHFSTQFTNLCNNITLSGSRYESVNSFDFEKPKTKNVAKFFICKPFSTGSGERQRSGGNSEIG